MTEKEAIEWFNCVPNGTWPERQEYEAVFGIGEIVKGKMWICDGVFTLGVEYGIRIALAKIFDLTPETIWDIGGDE